MIAFSSRRACLLFWTGLVAPAASAANACPSSGPEASGAFSQVAKRVKDSIVRGSRTGAVVAVVGVAIAAVVSTPLILTAGVAGFTLGMGYELFRGTQDNAETLANAVTGFD